MQEKNRYHTVRRPLAVSSPYGRNSLNLKNPWLALAFSFTFPGFGHFYVNAYLTGMVLMVWEYAVNNLASLNLCIFYSLLGDFDLAKQVVDKRWFLGYGVIYIFCMWDSYRRAIELNNEHLLGLNERQKNIPPVNVSTLEINVLQKKDPWISMIWSLLTPGTSTIYLQKVGITIFTLFWGGVVAYKAHLLDGLLYTGWGDFKKVKEIIDPQWLLFLPSIYGFVAHQSYEDAIETTRTYKYQQANFLKDEYQSAKFVMPFSYLLRGSS